MRSDGRGRNNDVNVMPVSVTVRGLHARKVSQHGEGGVPPERLHQAAQVRGGHRHLSNDAVRGAEKWPCSWEIMSPLGLRQGPEDGASNQDQADGGQEETHPHTT